MDEFWLFLHLVAAAVWLGGLVTLSVVAVVARRNLEPAAFRTLMRAAGRAFLFASVGAWTLLGISGAGLAWPRLGHALANLWTTGWGRTLTLKTALFVVALMLTAAHTLTGRRVSSPAAVAASRAISPVIFAITLVIVYLAVRLTEG